MDDFARHAYLLAMSHAFHSKNMVYSKVSGNFWKKKIFWMTLIGLGRITSLYLCFNNLIDSKFDKYML